QWSSLTTLMVIIGPFLGGVLAENGFWRWIFWMNLPIGAVAMAIALLRIPERLEPKQGPVDGLGLCALFIGLFGITYGLLLFPEEGVNPLWGWLGISIGIAALGFLIWIESRVTHPIISLRHFKSREFVLINLQTFLIYAALGISFILLSLNLVQIQGYRQSLAGLAIVPIAVIISLLSSNSGKFSDRFGRRWFLTVGPLLLAFGYLLHSSVGATEGPGQYWSTFFPGIVLMGLGLATLVAPLTTAAMSSVPTEESGMASGFNNAVSRISGLLAIASLGSLALIYFRTDLRSETESLLSPEQAEKLFQASAQFGATQIPSSIPSPLHPILAQAIDTSFLESFRLVLFGCAALCCLGAICGFLCTGEKRAD
ncbi:MAG: MFS transporter, partial [Okeania sp. SIO1H5]|uniref:MFS transporter n=1 Tax=Okeania sp. SIO1H5 TaxID=2607777 RepID=UPI0013B6324F